MPINIPNKLTQNIKAAYGQDGRDWLLRLPGLLEETCKELGIELGSPFSDCSYNYVASGSDKNGREIVIKMGLPTDELKSEIEALKIYKGNAAVEVIKSNADKGWLLLERLEPGDSLLSLADETQRTAVVAKLAKALWINPPRSYPWPHIRDHFAEIQKLKDGPEIAPKPDLVNLINKGLLFFEEVQDDSQDRLLHGDLHHLNILKGKKGWVAIDAKGAIGNPLYDLGAYLLNPVNISRKSNWESLTAQRIGLFANALKVDKKMIAKWGFAVAVLRAIWSLHDADSTLEEDLSASRVFLAHC